jgi:hypothetical protein
MDFRDALAQSSLDRRSDAHLNLVRCLRQIRKWINGQLAAQAQARPMVSYLEAQRLDARDLNRFASGQLTDQVVVEAHFAQCVPIVHCQATPRQRRPKLEREEKQAEEQEAPTDAQRRNSISDGKLRKRSKPILKPGHAVEHPESQHPRGYQDDCATSGHQNDIEQDNQEDVEDLHDMSPVPTG